MLRAFALSLIICCSPLWSCAHVESMDPFHTMAQAPLSAAAPYQGADMPEPKSPHWATAPPQIEEGVLNLATCIRIGVELNPNTQASWQAMKAAAARSFVASAEESARLAEGECKAGAGDIIALLDAQTALTSARNRLVQARFGWYVVRAQFEKAVGRSLTSDVESRMSNSKLNLIHKAQADTREGAGC